MSNLLILLLILVLVAGGSLWAFGSSFIAPSPYSIGEPPEGLDVETVRIPKADASYVAGWFISGEEGRPGIVLAHGVRASRMTMLGRARFLLDAGYGVLLIDLQAHGESPGEQITFGFAESRDIHAAVRYLRNRLPDKDVGVIGSSLGGAASLLGDSPVQADALIIEAVYGSIEHAIRNRLRMRLGRIGEYFAPALLWQLKPRLGIAPEQLSPLQAIRNLKAPVFIIAGAEDRHTTRAESESLYQAAQEPKTLWLIDGARHESLHAYAGAEYERRVLEFFDSHLK